MAPGDKLPDFLTNTPLHSSFDKDIKDTHLVYDYDAQDGNGRINYQRAIYQCIRPDELWQINWLKETGTVVSVVYDIPRKKITALISFSEGHWRQAEVAHGDRRHKENLEKWRRLTDVGNQTSQFMLSEQADIVEVFKGKGNLVSISEDDPTF